VRGLLKSNPGEYIKILDLESDFKEKHFHKLDHRGYTLLMQAIELGAETLSLDMIKSKKMDVFKVAPNGVNAFFLAVFSGNLKIVEALVKCGEEVEPKKCGKYGAPLLWAAKAGNIELIDYFLKNGADINKQTMKIKDTALISACLFLKNDAIFHLIEKGADKTIRNKAKLTAKDIYINNGGKNKKVIKLLS
jgi:ankyrin repeat protein